MASITNRMLRAAKLDAQLYEEVEADKSSMQQAMMVVVMSSLAAGLATLVQGGIVGLVVGTLAALVSWYIWAYLTYFIGTKLFSRATNKGRPWGAFANPWFCKCPWSHTDPWHHSSSLGDRFPCGWHLDAVCHCRCRSPGPCLGTVVAGSMRKLARGRARVR